MRIISKGTLIRLLLIKKEAIETAVPDFKASYEAQGFSKINSASESLKTA